MTSLEGGRSSMTRLPRPRLRASPTSSKYVFEKQAARLRSPGFGQLQWTLLQAVGKILEVCPGLPFSRAAALLPPSSSLCLQLQRCSAAFFGQRRVGMQQGKFR